MAPANSSSILASSTAQRSNFLGESTAEISYRRARRRSRFGIDDIRNRRRGMQIHLSVEKGASRKLTGLGEPGTTG